MSLVAYILVILLSLDMQVQSKSACQDDGLSISDFRKSNDGNRQEQMRRELSSDSEENGEEDPPTQEAVVKESVEVQTQKIEMPTNEGSIDLKKAMENEGGDANSKEAMSKRKREICDRILEQLRDLPCDNPVVLTCGGENRLYPCTGNRPVSPLRAALSDVDNILGAAEVVPQPALVPSVLPSTAQVSPVQTLPVSPQAMAANLLPGVRGIVSQPALPYMAPNRILTAEERRERQKGIFEGLLRLLFSTVHVFDDVSDPLHHAAHSILGMDAPQFLEDLSLRSYPRSSAPS